MGKKNIKFYLINKLFGELMHLTFWSKWLQKDKNKNTEKKSDIVLTKSRAPMVIQFHILFFNQKKFHMLLKIYIVTKSNQNISKLPWSKKK